MWFVWLLPLKGGERRGVKRRREEDGEGEGRGWGGVEQALDRPAALGSQPPTLGCAASLASRSELSLVTDVDSAIPSLQALQSTHPRVAFRVSFS